MAKTPERVFYEWITRQLTWHFQRIETQTADGVPDIWACSKGHSLWIETKACSFTNVQIRKAQYAWMSKALWNGIHTWVWNRDPKKPANLQMWRTPFGVETGRKDHLRIVSPALITIPSKSLRGTDIVHFTNPQNLK